MKPKAIIIGTILGAVTAGVAHIVVMGGSEVFGEWVLGQEARQRIRHLVWFAHPAVLGYVVAALGTLLLRLKGVAPGRLLVLAFGSMGVLALLLPWIVVVFFERHSEDLYLCYLIAMFLLGSSLLTKGIAARQIRTQSMKEKPNMKSAFILTMWFAALAAIGGTVPKPGWPAARDTATAYFEALMKGDVGGVNALVAAPFSFDRKQVLQTKEEVEKKHQEIVAKKGKRKVPEYTVGIPAKAPELDRKIFPEYEVFRITIAGDDEHIDIYVSKGATPKVIGFSD